MNEKQVASIEKAFSISLPRGYRELLKDTPPLFQAWIQCEEKLNPCQSPFFMDHRMVIDVNRMMRDPDHPNHFEFDPNDISKPWPQKYFIIGSDVGGNYFCIVPATKTSKVYFWEQGQTGFCKYADNIGGFVKRLFRDYGEVEAMYCPRD